MSETWIAARSVVGGIPVALDAAELVSITGGAPAASDVDFLDVADVLRVDASAESDRRCVTVDRADGVGVVMLGRQISIAELPASSRIDPPKLVTRTFTENGWAGLALFEDELSLILTLSGLIAARNDGSELRGDQDDQ